MNLHLLLNRATKVLKSNGPEIFTGMGAVGVLATAYLTARAAYVASEVIHTTEAQSGTHADPKERFKERARHTWRLYIPAAVSGTVTIGCIVGASKASGQRTAAAVAAYSLTEKAFSDYREKIVEQIGVNKEQAVRDQIAQERVSQNPDTPQTTIIVGGGHVLCCELHTGRYFRSDMETLKRRLNEINHKIHTELYVDLNEWYELIGLPYTSRSGGLGWNSEKLLDLEFSSVLSESGEPCLAFDYNYIKPL